jgi:hypothetical protein
VTRLKPGPQINRGSFTGKVFLLSTVLKPGLGPFRVLFRWVVTAFASRVRRPERDANHAQTPFRWVFELFHRDK